MEEGFFSNNELAELRERRVTCPQCHKEYPALVGCSNCQNIQSHYEDDDY